jgi:GNAT superfamily N-acetyltransferase
LSEAVLGARAQPMLGYACANPTYALLFPGNGNVADRLSNRDQLLTRLIQMASWTQNTAWRVVDSVDVVVEGEDMAASTVANASESEKERAVAALVAAFVSGPFIRWIFPDPRQYLVYFPQVLKYFAGRAFDHQSAYRSEDFRATALWLPPGVGPDEEEVARVMEEGVDEMRLGEVFAVLEQAGGSHPPVEHWYLPAMGVDPRWQGKGYSSALLTRGLEVCDVEHVAAYLEATNPANIPLYERFGFEVVGEIQVGGSPVIIAMLRAAR